MVNQEHSGRIQNNNRFDGDVLIGEDVGEHISHVERTVVCPSW